MYSSIKIFGLSTTREPTTKKVAVMSLSSRYLSNSLYKIRQVGYARCDKRIKSIPSVWSRTVIETDTPGVLGWADSDVCSPGISTARPPSIVSSLGKVSWTAGASSVRQRNVRDLDPIELLHPNRHLIGEESWKLLNIEELPGFKQ